MSVIDAYYLVLSHADRLKMNQMVNWHLAERQTQRLFLKCQGTLKGVRNQPQHMIVLPGMELQCVTRRSIINGPVILRRRQLGRHAPHGHAARGL